MAFTWKDGRKLASFTQNNETTTYTYDSNTLNVLKEDIYTFLTDIEISFDENGKNFDQQVYRSMIGSLL